MRGLIQRRSSALWPVNRLLFTGSSSEMVTPSETIGWTLDRYGRGVSSVFLAGLSGWLGWSGSLLALLLLPVFTWAWSRTESRLWAFAAALSYYLAGSRGLVRGGAVFFASPGELSFTMGILVWFTPALLLGIVWALCWRRGVTIVPGCLAALVIVGVPPVGVIGWVSPLTAAGALFPGWGWVGLGLTAGWLMLTAYQGQMGRSQSVKILVLVLSGLAGVANITTRPGSSWSGWTGVDTTLSPEQNGGTAAAEALQKGMTRTPYVLMPETVGGDWTFTEDFWARQGDSMNVRGHGALIGALLPQPAGGYRNALVGVGALSGTKYLQRVPVPLSMWRPWDIERHVEADWFGPGVILVSNQRTAVLICYETLLLWPVLNSASQGATQMAWVANDWWARDTSIPVIQHVASRSWAALFGWDSISAINL